MTGEQHEAIVIGGGFAGLATARELRRRGLTTIVLERTATVGSSWRTRPDNLRLNTWRLASRLPGRVMPRRTGPWPHRQEVIAYLERYVKTERIQVRYGVEAIRVEREGSRWRVITSCGELEAAVVVVATGHDREPVLPKWPGIDGYLGELIHSSAYRSALRYRKRDVLVVGVGNSGAEVATDLAVGGVRRVRMAVRTGVNLFGDRFLGLPITVWAFLMRAAPVGLADLVSLRTQRLRYGDLAALGVVPAPWGMATEMRLKGKGPVLDRGFSNAIRDGRIEVVAAVSGFDGQDVVLASGERLRPDLVIAATGYRAGLEALVGHLAELDEWGRPACRNTGVDPDAHGLYFVGYALPLSGQLPEMAWTASRVASVAANHVRALRRSKGIGRPSIAPARPSGRGPSAPRL